MGALEKVEFAYSGKDFVLAEDLFRFTTPSKNDNETLKEVYINAESVVLYNSDVFRNRDSAITAKIYVKNENVKNTILEETAKGDYPVSADQIIVQSAAASLDYLKITEFTGNTTFDRCVDSLGPGAIYGKGSFAIYGYNPDMGASIISDDDINTIQSMSTALKKISAEVEVSGSVDSPFTLAFEGCDSSITEDFDNAWYSSALGTEILDNKCTHTTASVTEAGTYTVEIMLENDAVFNGICNLDLHSLETGASTKNPNAEIKLKSVTFGEESEADLVDATNIFNYDIMDNVVFFYRLKIIIRKY